MLSGQRPEEAGTTKGPQTLASAGRYGIVPSEEEVRRFQPRRQYHYYQQVIAAPRISLKGGVLLIVPFTLNEVAVRLFWGTGRNHSTEQILCNHQVVSSSLITGSTLTPIITMVCEKQ